MDLVGLQHSDGYCPFYHSENCRAVMSDRSFISDGQIETDVVSTIPVTEIRPSAGGWVVPVSSENPSVTVRPVAVGEEPVYVQSLSLDGNVRSVKVEYQPRANEGFMLLNSNIPVTSSPVLVERRATAVRVTLLEPAISEGLTKETSQTYYLTKMDLVVCGEFPGNFLTFLMGQTVKGQNHYYYS